MPRLHVTASTLGADIAIENSSNTYALYPKAIVSETSGAVNPPTYVNLVIGMTFARSAQT